MTPNSCCCVCGWLAEPIVYLEAFRSVFMFLNLPLYDLSNPWTMTYPWLSLSNWQPFRVDALGLVTLLGQEEINTYVGRLVLSRWLEYMPLLAVYVIAGDRFRRKIPSFHLYNISTGIHTTDCAAWFTRWIQCQNFETTRSVVYWDMVKKPQSQLLDHVIAASLSFCLTGLLLAMTIISHDLYGLANVCAIIVSILTRSYVLRANRRAIDRSIRAILSPEDPAKLIVITPDSKVITMFIPNKLVVPVFVRNPQPSCNQLYNFVRWIGWLAFGIHAVSLGMATLATQLYTITLIIIPSILICQGFGCLDTVRPYPVNFNNGDTRAYTCWIGSHLKATVFEWPSYLEFEKKSPTKWGFRDFPHTSSPDQRSARRMDLYAWLNLTAEEEDSFAKWDLLPHKRRDDPSWENEFNAKKALIREHRPDIREIRRIVVRAVERGPNGKDKDSDTEDGRDISEVGHDPLALQPTAVHPFHGKYDETAENPHR